MIDSIQLQVLYVESRPLDAIILRAGLSVYGIEMHHLSAGDESLFEELALSRYDGVQTIILDMDAGDLNGLQIARRLRAEGDKRPIVIVSGNDRPTNSELMAIQAMFVAKPFDFDRISDAVKKLAARG